MVRCKRKLYIKNVFNDIETTNCLITLFGELDETIENYFPSITSMDNIQRLKTQFINRMKVIRYQLYFEFKCTTNSNLIKQIRI